MSVSLLTNTIATPDGRQAFHDGPRVGTLLSAQISDERRIPALVAILRPLTLPLVLTTEAIGVKWYCVRQTLHYGVEEACVSKVVHWVGNSLWQCKLLLFSL